jgi:nucleoside 2-deoxyribosyltransferase
MSAYTVYLAAPFVARDGLRPFVGELNAIGMHCTSSWLFGDVAVKDGVGTAPSQSDETIAKDCLDDLRAIDSARAVVQFTGNAIETLRIPDASGPMLHTGGRHVELGYAIAKKKPLIVIGDPENIFQRSLATVVPDWHAAVLALVALERACNMPQAVPA